MVREYPVGIWLLRIREGKYKRPLVSRNLNTSGQNPSRFPPPEVPSQNPIITEKNSASKYAPGALMSNLLIH